jgi:hypothetical protein
LQAATKPRQTPSKIRGKMCDDRSVRKIENMAYVEKVEYDEHYA